MLHHPNIVELEEVLESPHSIYFVMKLCGGGNLAEYVNVEPLTESVARGYFGQVFVLFCFVLLILFYFILFYFVLFCFVLFYFILFYFILFYFILFYFILFYFILFYYLCLITSLSSNFFL